MRTVLEYYSLQPYTWFDIDAFVEGHLWSYSAKYDVDLWDSGIIPLGQPRVSASFETKERSEYIPFFVCP